MNTEIKNIVFDFGGILFDLDIDGSINRLSQLMGLNFKTVSEVPKSLLAIFEGYERGEINTESLIWNVQYHSTHPPQGLEVIRVWNSMLVGMKFEKFQKLLDLKEKYNIFLLSNINDLHLNWVYTYFNKNYNISDWDKKYFNKTYYSHLIGKRKPSKDIFEYVWHDAGITPKESLFIDDTLSNVQMAQSMGIHTIHHDAKNDIFEVLNNYFNTPKN